MKPFNKYMRDLRIKRGLSQSQVGRRLRLTSGQIVSNFERGFCYPPLRKLDAICELYRVDTRKVFNRMLKEWVEKDWHEVKGGE